MGREVRRVPKEWKHPTDEHGDFIPLLGRSYTEEVREWDKGAEKWAQGLRTDFKGGWQPRTEDEAAGGYDRWDGSRPVQSDYMPEWTEVEATHWMMYEDTTEGTPISPAFETLEELARWLTDSGASRWGNTTSTYEGWLEVCYGGFGGLMLRAP